ncbi:MAG: hypothetical protein ABI999_08510 [Acidobacteriota bacterium]
MTPKEHNRLVGIFLMVHAALQAVVVGLICLIYGGIGVGLMLGSPKGEDQAVGIGFIVAIAVVGVFGLAFLLPQLIGGWRLYKERPNARIWGIVGSILASLSFPLGTAAGVYGMWFLFGDDGKRFYLGNAVPYQQIPPTPGSWQQ